MGKLSVSNGKTSQKILGFISNISANTHYICKALQSLWTQTLISTVNLSKVESCRSHPASRRFCEGLSLMNKRYSVVLSFRHYNKVLRSENQ